jgi:hypothetical protein
MFRPRNVGQANSPRTLHRAYESSSSSSSPEKVGGMPSASRITHHASRMIPPKKTSKKP